MATNSERERHTIDAAIAAAVASLRDVVNRLEAGSRQYAAEVLMRRSGAVEELIRQTDLLLPTPGHGAGWRRWLRFGRRP